MNNKNKILFSLLGVVLIIGATVGVTFAFFNYTRTGRANTISVGRILFTTNQVNTINLTNVFPISRSTLTDDPTNENIGTFEIEITGDTDYADGVEYLVSTANTHVYTGTGKVVPISLDVTVTDLGTPTDSYFTARESKNATIYKRLSGNSVIGDQQLLVGYIKPNTTLGTAEGVDGSITIKAFLDADKIAISDTYNENGIVTDNLGTTSEWVDDRVVLTTNEWNALQNSGISFQVRVEANEGIWVDEPIYNKLRVNAVMDNINSTNVTNATPGIDFSKISGDTDSDGDPDNGEGLYVRATTENDAYPVVYYRGAVEDNNVYFAGKCWQIIRTTETGGTKMIYNGENTGTSDAPACENTTGASRQITLNIDETDTNTFAFSGTNINSPTYSGYTWGIVYNATKGDYAANSKFGNGVTWDGSNYIITNVSDTLDKNHHYTCGTSGTTICSTIRYYFTYYGGVKYYFTLENGKTIEDIVNESLQNGNNESNAKVRLEDWYEANIYNTVYESQIEDTIYCNDRSIYSLGGMNPNGGLLTSESSMIYSGNQRNSVEFNPSTKCNRVADSFTKEIANGNGLLDYSVGLITIDEIAMAGGKSGTANANFYLYTGASYWSLSPHSWFSSGYAYEFIVYFLGGSYDGYVYNGTVSFAGGLRPVISLKSETSIVDGDGTAANPYIVK